MIDSEYRQSEKLPRLLSHPVRSQTRNARSTTQRLAGCAAGDLVICKSRHKSLIEAVHNRSGTAKAQAATFLPEGNLPTSWSWKQGWEVLTGRACASDLRGDLGAKASFRKLKLKAPTLEAGLQVKHHLQ